ncbi:DUF732 domain-containing protein [Dietzia lutea]|nr:DUF732 domain-containing protein [Dietzia lutea]
MSTRSRATGVVVATGAVLAAVLAGCGGATVEGEAPEVSSEPTTSAPATPFAEELPEKPTEPIPPPPPQSPEPEPMPGEPEPLPLPSEAAPDPGADPSAESAPPAQPAPGAGDFAALLERRGVTLPAGLDPVATATEACGRFDGGQQMDEVSGWLGDHARLDPDGQGFFLGAAVGTYCPQNFPKLG